MKIYVSFSGIELKMESKAERLAWSQLRRLLESAELVDGAGVACEQLSKGIVTDSQVFPSKGAALTVE
jgi:hypothetical protein